MVVDDVQRRTSIGVDLLHASANLRTVLSLPTAFLWHWFESASLMLLCRRSNWRRWLRAWRCPSSRRLALRRPSAVTGLCLPPVHRDCLGMHAWTISIVEVLTQTQWLMMGYEWKEMPSALRTVVGAL